MPNAPNSPQIIKDDDLVSAFLAHRFFRWE
jgi:hypothetical protein